MEAKKLSDFLVKGFNESNKIELTFRDIEAIDKIDSKFHTVSQLDLSYNQLITLEGIDQFICLTHLNLANNLIENFEELEKISKRDKLMVLSIKGNPLARHPNIIPLIIQNFPRICEIDGETINEATKRDIKDAEEISRQLIPYFYENEQIMIKLHQNLSFLNLKLELIEFCAERLPPDILPSSEEIMGFHHREVNKYPEMPELGNIDYEKKIRPYMLLEFMRNIRENFDEMTQEYEEEIVCKIYRWIYCEIILHLHNRGSPDLQCFLQRYEHEGSIDAITSDLFFFSQLSYCPGSLMHFPVFGCNNEYLRALYSVLHKQAIALKALIIDRTQLLLYDTREILPSEVALKSNSVAIQPSFIYEESADSILSPPNKLSYPENPHHFEKDYSSPSFPQNFASPADKLQLQTADLESIKSDYLSPKFPHENILKDRLGIPNSNKFIEEELEHKDIVSRLEFDGEMSDMNFSMSREELSQTIEDLLNDDDDPAVQFYNDRRKCVVFSSWKDIFYKRLRKEERAESKYKLKLAEKAFLILKNLKNAKIAALEQLEENSVLKYSRNLMKNIISMWRAHSLAMNTHRVQVANFYKTRNLKLKALKGFTLYNMQKQEMFKKSENFLKDSLKRKTLFALKNKSNAQVKLRENIRIMRLKKMKGLIKKLLKGWLHLVRPSAKYVKREVSMRCESDVDKLINKINKTAKAFSKDFKLLNKKSKLVN
ncbi:unnamed protein product [Blepharisma stoltei]|uniref:Uncharacterized protein n=1 Tax=Blepharisma stoltei TaxID=1481888 RepID=A0AAU9JPD4_9CILI|nr:unnamed protein product [Blepharisma stoltei]